MIYTIGEPTVLEVAEKIIQQQGYATCRLDILAISKLKPQKILICDPVHLSSRTVISTIWRTFFAKKAPETKILLVGFERISHSNYVSLIHSPPDFEDLFLAADAADCAWKAPLGGVDSLEIMKQFYKGHGGKSFLAKATDILATMNIMQYKISVEHTSLASIEADLVQPILKPELIELYHRWMRYTELFEYLPFHRDFLEMAKLLTDFSQYLDDGNLASEFESADLYKKFKRVMQRLEEIDSTYIRPEQQHG